LNKQQFILSAISYITRAGKQNPQLKRGHMNVYSRIRTNLLKLTLVTAIVIGLMSALPAHAAGSNQGKQTTRTQTTKNAASDRASATMVVTIYDGARHPFASGKSLLIRVFDGNQKQIVSGFYKGSTVQFVGLPIHGNLTDTYRVVASAKGYNTAGASGIQLRAGQSANVSIMLLPSHGQLEFDSWSKLQQNYPWLATLLSNGTADNEQAKARYDKLMADDPGALAALLNITTAGHQIAMDQGLFISYFKQIVWDEQPVEWRNHHMVGFNPLDDTEHAMRHDRFWAYADRRLVAQVKAGVKEGTFFVEHGSQVFHPGATGSFKENNMEEGHIHVSFYENQSRVIDGVDCVLLEIHIDLYKDLLAHGVLEVLPNTLTGHLTEPEDAYQHRWNAAINSGTGDFAPPLTIVPFTGAKWHRHITSAKNQQ
jgi:hypothetical protein